MMITMMMQIMEMTSLTMMMMQKMMMMTFLRNLFSDEKNPKLSKWPWRR